MIKTFTYTKANGSVSQRTTVSIKEPYNMYQAIDVSELNEDDQTEFAVAFSKLRDAHNQAVAELMAKYDVTHNFRQFDPLKMTDVETHY